MAGIGNIVLLLGVAVGGYLLWQHKDELAGLLKLHSGAPTPITTTATTTPITSTIPSGTDNSNTAPKTTPSATGDLYLVTAADNKLGPANCASSAHEADKGFGFSKDGGPVAADGFTSDEGEPRVGDNRNNKTMTIAQLPGPCETKPYKGKVQYRFKDLSASCETCVLAKRYFLYKYGVGGVNPIPGTGGEGIREGGKSTGKVVPQRAVKGAAKAKYAGVEQYNAFFTYNRVSI